MQVAYLQLNSNELTGSLPSTWQAMANLQYMDLSRNSLNGTFVSAALPSNFSYLDLSYNKMIGALPGKLSPSLSVLNLTHNGFVQSLPAQWSVSTTTAVFQLDSNPITGNLPKSWADFGGNTGNSVQLSAVNTSLRGTIPQEWVQQFCLNVVNNGSRPEARTLYQPQQIPLTFAAEGLISMSIFVGEPVVLPPQYASIHVTLEHKIQSLTYSDRSDVCEIPHVVRNIALLWFLFAALLLAIALGLYFWFRRMPTSLSHFTKQLTTKFERLVLQHRAW